MGPVDGGRLMVAGGEGRRLAATVVVDEAVPGAFVEAAARLVPDVDVRGLRAFAPDLVQAGDVELVEALAARGVDALVTCTWPLVEDAATLSAVERSGLVLVVVGVADDDPAIAVGALLRDVVGAVRRGLPPGSVLRVRPGHHAAIPAADLRRATTRRPHA